MNPMMLLAVFICGFWVLVGLFIVLLGRHAEGWLKSSRFYPSVPAIRFIGGGMVVLSTVIGGAVVLAAVVVLLIVAFHS